MDVRNLLRFGEQARARIAAGENGSTLVRIQDDDLLSAGEAWRYPHERGLFTLDEAARWTEDWAAGRAQVLGTAGHPGLKDRRRCACSSDSVHGEIERLIDGEPTRISGVGASYAKGLPEFCYVAIRDVPAELRIRIVRRGESGLHPASDLPHAESDDEAEKVVMEANRCLGVSPLQAFCMLTGSRYGWDRLGADPKWMAARYPGLYGENNSGALI